MVVRTLWIAPKQGDRFSGRIYWVVTIFGLICRAIWAFAAWGEFGEGIKCLGKPWNLSIERPVFADLLKWIWID